MLVTLGCKGFKGFLSHLGKYKSTIGEILMNWKMRGWNEKYRHLAFNIIPCIYVVHGNWSHWTSWPNCNKPCNNGTRTRRRACDNPRPAFGGENCEGLTFESEPCNQEKCPGRKFLDLFFVLAC